VTATFPANNYNKDSRPSEISFVCADKENDGRRSNIIFNLQSSKANIGNVSDRTSDLVINKKLDFNRLSNPKFTLIKKEGRNSLP